MMLIRFVWRIIDARTSSRVFREGKWHLQHSCFLPVNRVQRRKNDSLRRRCRSTVRRRNNNLIIIVVVSSLYLLIFPFFSRHVKLDPSTVTNATAPRTLVARTRSTTPPCRKISRRWPAATGAAWKWCNTPEGVSDFVRPDGSDLMWEFCRARIRRLPFVWRKIVSKFERNEKPIRGGGVRGFSSSIAPVDWECYRLWAHSNYKHTIVDRANVFSILSKIYRL